MEDTARLARLLSELRGGYWGAQEDQDAAKATIAAWPKATDAIRWHDRFRSAVAEDAVTRGIAAVVFAGAGFPFGDDAPHTAAARASATARSWYPEPNAVVAGQRGISLEGDSRAVAFAASLREPRGMLRAAGLLGDDDQWLGDGPCQLQFGLEAGVMGTREAARVAAEYGQLLPSGSEIVIAVPDRDEGRQFARIAGLRPHTARDVERWIRRAGLKLDGPFDVRAYGRQALGEGLRASGGRIMAAVGIVP